MRKRRQRRVYLNLFLLVLLLANLLALYWVLQGIENGQNLSTSQPVQTVREESALFKSGQTVQLLQKAQTSISGEPLEEFKPLVGQVVAVETVDSQGESKHTYRVRYGASWEVAGLLEEDLRPVDVPYALGQEVALVEHVRAGQFEDGLVTGIRLEAVAGKMHYTYTADFTTLGQVTDLVETDFVPRIALDLKEENSPEDNDHLIRQALEQARNNPATRIDFPTGRFAIGSQTPEKDYQILASNLDLRGQDTTLVVHGSARWFGLATGPEAVDGLSNFAMSGLTIEAKDLVKGNQFIIMANHGHNWQITNNRFVLVHQLSSHIFDLGGVQEAVFTGNVFEGYAPELTPVTELGQYRTHNMIAEAIQFDAASSNGEWDGGMLLAIDPNYLTNNPHQQISHHITVTDNYFLPYRDQAGNLVAYGASIGQHSSDVGYVTIVNNVFSETLSSRFIDQVAPSDQWLFDPIHVSSEYSNAIYGNYFE